MKAKRGKVIPESTFGLDEPGASHINKMSASGTAASGLTVLPLANLPTSGELVTGMVTNKTIQSIHPSFSMMGFADDCMRIRVAGADALIDEAYPCFVASHGSHPMTRQTRS